MVSELVGLLAGGITIATAVPTFHSYISSFTIAKRVEADSIGLRTRLLNLHGELLTVNANVRRIADRIYQSDHSGIKSSKFSLDLVQPTIENLSRLTGRGEVIVDKAFSIPSQLKESFEANPEETLKNLPVLA